MMNNFESPQVFEHHTSVGGTAHNDAHSSVSSDEHDLRLLLASTPILKNSIRFLQERLIHNYKILLQSNNQLPLAEQGTHTIEEGRLVQLETAQQNPTQSSL
ncbi:MAG TPA: hypothetical protein DCW55_04020 [Candidatus Pacebacteria bacterium]|nr:hypothetical protein [Candidatus Paceibacterota bacterium]HAX01349.1 hypothetical protein [Candidatus Paceibacterota bacterium]